MSVPASKRKEADTLFYTNMYRLYDNMTKFLLRDFGTKPLKDLRVFTNRAKMDIDDKIDFINLANKYKLDIEISYPLWVLEHFRNSIMNTLDKILQSITSAYTIYPNSVYECDLKREYIWKAINGCNILKQTLQRALSIFVPKKVDLEKYMKYIEDIDKEIELLKKWKQNENKTRRKCIDNDINLYNQSYERLSLGLDIPAYNKLKKAKEEQIKKEKAFEKIYKEKQRQEEYQNQVKESTENLKSPVFFYKDYTDCRSEVEIKNKVSMIYIGYSEEAFRNKYGKIKIEVKAPIYTMNPLFTIYSDEKKCIPEFSKVL